MELEIRPWQWALAVAWALLLTWRLAIARAAIAPAPYRPPTLVRHPNGQPVRLIVGQPGTEEHVVHIWNDED